MSWNHTHHDHLYPHHKGQPHATEMINEAVSQLAPYATLILVISLVVIFLARYYLVEGYLMKRIHGSNYTKLDERQRRGFVNHHVALGGKCIMFSVAAYPFFAIVAGTANFHHPFAPGSVVTFGDILLVLNQAYVALYLHELAYRSSLSYVTVAHHIGTIVIATSAVIISLNWEHQVDATIEFILCYIWGVFDGISEFWLHISIILFRMRPKDHLFLKKVFYAAMAISIGSTIVETVVVMYFWGWAWHRWTLAFKIATPILHTVFSGAQLWGAYNFYCLWQHEKKCLRLEVADSETGSTTEEWGQGDSTECLEVKPKVSA